MSRSTPKAFAELLRDAVQTPGILSQAYQQFHTFSLGNQLLAMVQCHQRGLEPGPMATYPKWRELGRQVRKGEKALTLCMPVTIKRKEHKEHSASPAGPAHLALTRDPAPPAHRHKDEQVYTRFVYKSRWFVLSQTEGEPLPEEAIPTWDVARALEALNVEEIPFTHTNGNCLGFARDRSIALNPINSLPHKTRFHELAHVQLGHTAEGLQADSENTPRNLRECEAEAVALLCCAALELPGLDECRGYIQSWWGQGQEIPDRSAQRILKVADQILKAGVVTGGAS